MAKPSRVTAQFDWTAVKEKPLDWGGMSYDVWEWNVWKLKWVRLSNTACGYGSTADASIYAKQRSDEIQAMLDNNRTKPPAL